MPRRPLYEPHPDYPDRVKLPLHLYGGGTVQPGETVAISIGSRTTTEALCDFELRNMIEDQITDLFLGLPSSQVVFAEQFGMSGSKLWCIVRAPRHVLLPSSKEGQPGDFDAIVGRIVDDTYVDLSTLCLVEFKVGKAPPTSEAARSALPKFATSKGTKQAGAAAELGFDFVLLAHFLVRDAGEGAAANWSSAADSANFRVETERLRGSLLKSDDDPPYGIVSLGMGHVQGSDPHISGALSPTHVHRAPRLARRSHTLRAELENSIRARIPVGRKAEPFFRFCDKCGRFFGTSDARLLYCNEHVRAR